MSLNFIVSFIFCVETHICFVFKPQNGDLCTRFMLVLTSGWHSGILRYMCVDERAFCFSLFIDMFSHKSTLCGQDRFYK